MIQDLSPKQTRSIVEATARINIWAGAVRSGKTLASMLRFLEFVREAPKGNLLIIGRTSQTIKRNIIDEFYNLLGADPKYFIGKNEMHLWGRTFHLIGCSDERAEQKIRGLTAAGAYVDEITLIPESFWTMLLSRLSIPGAKLFGTTNPDSPLHWLKTGYIDRHELDIKTFGFELDDNPSLTDEYKDALKLEYRGLWYQRFIEGKWVLAEGSVFDFFDHRIHTIQEYNSVNSTYYVGVDFGTSNPTSFVLIAHNPDHYPNICVVKEYYWDPKVTLRQKTADEFANDLVEFVHGYPVKKIYVDPSAATLKLELSKAGVRNIDDGDNEVLDGVRQMSTLLSTGTLKIMSQCTNLIAEMQGYIWDVNAQQRGLDKPKKDHDHAIDALRYGLTNLRRTLFSSPNLTPMEYQNLKNIYKQNDRFKKIFRKRTLL